MLTLQVNKFFNLGRGEVAVVVAVFVVAVVVVGYCRIFSSTSSE